MHNVFSRRDEYNVLRSYITSSKVLAIAKKYYNSSDIYL